MNVVHFSQCVIWYILVLSKCKRNVQSPSPETIFIWIYNYVMKTSHYQKKKGGGFPFRVFIKKRVPFVSIFSFFNKTESKQFQTLSVIPVQKHLQDFPAMVSNMEIDIMRHQYISYKAFLYISTLPNPQGLRSLLVLSIPLQVSLVFKAMFS